MKSALYLFLVYLSICVLGTALCAAIFMLCSDLTLCVVGQSYSIFSLSFFVKGIFYSFPAVCAFSHFSMVFYGIRHKLNKIITLVMFLVLGILSWAFLIPYSLNNSVRYTDLFNEVSEPKPLTEGFFRKERNEIYYYSNINENTADGFMIDRNGVSKVFMNEKIVKTPSAYADSLVQNEVEIPLIVSTPLKVYETLIISTKENFVAGGEKLFIYITFALAMLSVLGFQAISGWRLLNAFIVLCSGIGIVYLNYLFTIDKIDLPYFSADQWNLMLNGGIFIFLLLFGIIKAIIDFRKEKGL